MKGLIVKDIRLMMQRKMSFLIFILCGIGVGFSTESPYIVCWATFIGAIFSLSTVAYDEHGGGFPFLMTLPISRRCYAAEKYVFGAVCSAAFWLCGMIIYAVISALRGADTTPVAYFLFILLFPIIIIDVCIPFYLKFGAVKSRVYLIIFLGIIGALLLAAYRLVPSGTRDQVTSALASGRFAAAAAVVIAAAVTSASIAASIGIMNKKEF